MMFRNVSSNWFFLVVSVLATYFLLPFNLLHLGDDAYGVWLLIASLTSYLALLNLGVPMACARHLTRAIAQGDPAILNRLVASSAGLLLGLGTLAALLGLPLLVFFEKAYQIAPELQTESHWAFLVALVNVAIGFIAQLPHAIMDSYQDFVRKNVIASLMVLLRVGLNVGIVLWYPSLLVLALVLLAVTVIEMICLWIIILGRHKELRVQPAMLSLATIRQIFTFSAFVLLLNLGTQMSFQTDAIVIGKFLGPAQIPVFAVGNNLIMYLMQFLIGIAAVVYPLATTLKEKGKMEELRAVVLKWSKLAIALSWCAGLYLVVFGKDFLARWVGDEIAGPGSEVLRILMLSYFVFLPLRAVALPVLIGVGKPGRPTIAFLLAGLANLVLSLILVRPLGLAGVAWGTTIPNLVLSAVLLGLVCKELNIPVITYLASTLPRALVGFGLTFLATWALRSVWAPQTLAELAVSGVGTLALFGLVWVGFVFRNDPHVPLPRLARLLRHARRGDQDVADVDGSGRQDRNRKAGRAEHIGHVHRARGEDRDQDPSGIRKS
jgi:O-antigen/teichoic acid export membrane protein